MKHYIPFYHSYSMSSVESHETEEDVIKPSSFSKKINSATIALIVGIVVSLLLILAIWLLTPNLARFEDILLPDQGAAWYFWKLPERNSWILLSAWLLYAIHQIFIWATIFLAQKNKYKTTSELKKLNYFSLFGNLFFILLHIIHTQLFYDKTAQDMPVWTSQGSVILMLSIIIVMETPRRGFILGKKLNFKKEVIKFFRKYHGYYISWALIYTFWFHPATGTLAHIWGFFYMFLLLLQGSLMYTKIHTNKYWTVILESLVAIHGALVAVWQAQAAGIALKDSMWPMFFLGFAAMFVLAYMYGLGWPKYVQIIISSIYVLFMVWLYSSWGYGRDFSKLISFEFLWIPIILFGIALAFGYGGNLIVKLKKSSKTEA
ncbi:hypothetical protein NEF87_000585 [Candidatus Lokiarchaeum ossiferum]|uniref:Serine active site containing 1-like protein n=1 Tax=Candidatus Lokiarchaeum ossiferum TaxID=2951803 RepID=A0ABY6HLN2_9ARCH|nr:hypothetical protein NEF87_000585 [Candidatus Lokiarchaeum sp. B-35]